MDHAKRKLLQASLFGAGAVGIRALATGLPVGLFSQSRRAMADTTTPDAGPLCKNPQYLVLFSSGSGDPMSCNAPGSYDDPDSYHGPDSRMAGTSMTVGSTKTTGAAVWANMTPEILGRTGFFWSATYTNSHSDLAKVLRVQGSVQRQETLISFISKLTTSCLGPGGDAGVGGTVQPQPIVMANDLVTYEGSVISPINPQNLQAVLTGPSSPLLQNLQALRDKDVDSLNAMFKSSGTKSQIALLDQYANSQTEARNINQQILNDLSKITGNSRTDYNIACSVLLAMRMTPSIVMPLNFGGDNHGDPGLRGEAEQTSQSIGQIEDLYSRLKSYGIADNTTLMFQNVFSRTQAQQSRVDYMNGRDHNAECHCTIVISSAINAGVYGGIQLNASQTDFQAMPINSATGAAAADGDIAYVDGLASVAKTVAAACGVEEGQYDYQITNGVAMKVALKNA